MSLSNIEEELEGLRGETFALTTFAAAISAALDPDQKRQAANTIRGEITRLRNLSPLDDDRHSAMKAIEQLEHFESVLLT